MYIESENHRIFYIGKGFQDHQVQPYIWPTNPITNEITKWYSNHEELSLTSVELKYPQQRGKDS